jgi:hypothetical protein
MKKSEIVWLVLVTAFASSVIATAVASAETTLLAEWLDGGASITALASTETTEILSLNDTSNGSVVFCELVLEGSVGPNGEGEITELLTTGGVAVTLTAPLLCKRGAVCEESATDIEASPEGLPFHTLLFLAENGSFLDLIIKASFNMTCLVLGIKISDECTLTNAAGAVSNGLFGVEASIFVLEPLGTCSIGGAGRFDVAPQGGNLELLLTNTLSVSSE